MTLLMTSINLKRGAVLGVAALLLAACASTPPPHAGPEIDAVTGQTVVQAGDIAIAGQLVAHSIMALPEVADASKPPLVRFSGVTSAVNGPVDTSAYTVLLRDRLLLLTREKLRFVERQLPPLTSHKINHNKQLPAPIDVDTNADYQITAQLRGNFDDDTYRVEIEFIDLHSSQALFSGLYSIRKEAQDAATGATTIHDQQIEPTNTTSVDLGTPSSQSKEPSDNSGIQ